MLAYAAFAFSLAQSPDAVVTGTIADPSGAAIPAATVVATQTATGVATRTVSNESGIYVFPSLPPGPYRLNATKDGFRPLVYNDVVLEIGARLNLNLTLTLGEVAQSVEVSANNDTQLALETSSVGGVLNGKVIEDLPIPGRSAFSLLYTQAGLQGDNVSGTRRGALNITLDGVNAQDQRLNQGVSSPIFMSTDKIQEFRLVSSPADAELGRGSAQIQMLTRSGTNDTRGSLFWTHRNTVLNANTWFNNQRGTNPRTGEMVSPRNFLIRNQYGGRVGGPIKRNRTFYHFLYDAQKIRERNAITQTVLTETARQGIFRFFPNVRNGNTDSLSPVVNQLGQPVRPANAAGDLQAINLYTRDPNRARPDPTAARLLALTPLPNNFRVGDGLNTAGFSWNRPVDQNLWQANLKIDHNLNDAHRLAFAYTHEDRRNINGFSEQSFPGTPGGNTFYRNRFWTLNLWSTVKPTVLNEFRVGVLRPWLRFNAGWETEEGRGMFPTINGQLYAPVFGLVTDPLFNGDNPVGRISPLYQFTDNVTAIRGKHALKTGFEVRFSSSNGFNSADVLPRVNFGSGGSPVLNIDNVAIPGIGLNQANAIAMLNDLVGSVGSVVQALNSPGGRNPQFVPNEVKQRTWKRREYGVFFKDDWKVTPTLTLNLGVRWDFYGVPWDANGKTAALVGGEGALFGLSGNSFADAYQPGRLNGSLTRVEAVGPNTDNPNKKVHGDDFNNFSPAIGLSYRLPGFKKATILRSGYQISYERNSLRIVDAVSGDQPGLRERVTDNRGGYFNLPAVTLPLRPLGNPFDVVPLTDRTQTVRSFADNLRNPYIQNFNVSLQRELTKSSVLDVRYVGSKGTRLVRGTSINEQVIFENGILDAFRITQEGGNSPLLDRIFMGLNVPGAGVVNGTTVTGSGAVRRMATTQGHLALQNVATFADYLSSTNQFTGVRGGLLRRAGLPENFVYANPQFASSRLTGNFANSTWHSLQVEYTKRFAKGWSYQANWTYSKSLGEEEGDGEEMIDSYRDVRNRRLDKRLLGSHRTHIFRSSGIYELPFEKLTTRWKPLTGNWQIGAIFNMFSGEPVYLLSGRSSWNTFGDNTPVALAAVDKSLGNVTRQGNGVFYFPGLTQVPDPLNNGLTNDGAVRARSTLQAIADANGRLLLGNPAAGQLGNVAPNFLSGPGAFRLDLNLIKRIRLAERRNIELRADAINLTNSPQFGTPNADINSLSFGRITSASGERLVVLNLRVNF